MTTLREGAARDEWRTAYVNTHDNPADLLTKPLPSENEYRHDDVRTSYPLEGQIAVTCYLASPADGVEWQVQVGTESTENAVGEGSASTV